MTSGIELRKHRGNQGRVSTEKVRPNAAYLMRGRVIGKEGQNKQSFPKNPKNLLIFIDPICKQGAGIMLQRFIMIVKKTFRLGAVFLLQSLMPPSFYRNIYMTRGINRYGGE